MPTCFLLRLLLFCLSILPQAFAWLLLLLTSEGRAALSAAGVPLLPSRRLLLHSGFTLSVLPALGHVSVLLFNVDVLPRMAVS